MGQPQPLFVYFCSFQNNFRWKIVDIRGIRTRIDGVELDRQAAPISTLFI